jgi:hypothetical protein
MHAAIVSSRLTLHQMYRLAACARVQEDLGRPVCIEDMLPELDAEDALVGRFLREMVVRGFMRAAPRPEVFARRRCKFYAVDARWYVIADTLRAEGCLPGVCCECGSMRTVAFPFLLRFFCRDCLMEAHRSDYPELNALASAVDADRGAQPSAEMCV